MARVAFSNSIDEDDAAFLLWEEQNLRRTQMMSGGDFARPSPPPSTLKVKPAWSDSPTEDPTQRFTSIGIGLASIFSENLLSHPCLVIKRQCQVHRTAYRYHLTPFTILPVIINLQRRQGIITLWKGLGSSFLIRGITLGAEDLLSKLTPLPKDISCENSWKEIFRHLFLKGLSLVVVTPFFSANLVETVQSDIASEKPGIFDCLKEGFCRLLNRHITATSRLVPIWKLVPPTVFHGLLHYIIASLVSFITLRMLQMRELAKHRDQGEDLDTLPSAENCLLELNSACAGSLLADTLLFPLETVLHRLHLQGTRTIIDNLDTGLEVMPIITKYDGAFDCFNTIINEEGASGLYKGFGALVLQYAISIALIRVTKFVLTEIRKNKELR